MKPKLHILAIGIDKYVDQGWTPSGSQTDKIFPPLGLAVKDAKAFAAGMKRASAGLYDEVRVTLVLDEAATRAGLHKTVVKVAARCTPATRSSCSPPRTATRTSRRGASI
jgi:hypothetical protein